MTEEEIDALEFCCDDCGRVWTNAQDPKKGACPFCGSNAVERTDRVKDDSE